MTPPVIAIIGTGQMGSSLIGGLIRQGHPPEKLWGADTSAEKLAHLKHIFAIHTTTNNIEAVNAADIVIFAIKPQVFSSIATHLAEAVQARKPLVISIAAGIRETSIQHWLKGKIAIVRAMPNTPALIACGATALYANTNVTPSQINSAESILSAVGQVVWLSQESLMDTVTALSGSGPAYFFLMMEALEEAAEQLGLPFKIAHDLTLQTALGAARMAIESKKSLIALREAVTSPAGTTEKAVAVLEEHHLRDIFKNAVIAAKKRSEELATTLEKDP